VNVTDLIARPSAWLTKEPDFSGGIIVSSRVRLARNIAGEVFPSRAGEEASVLVWTKLRRIVSNLPSLGSTIVADFEELDSTDKRVLRERHLVSVEHSEKGAGCGVILREDETVSVMVNEEDHIRMQAMSPGGDLMAVWRKVDAVDSELAGAVRYAFSNRLGYLTACPTNVGTGMRASVMLHLPALSLLNEINAVVRGLTKIGLAVRGLLGEGTEAYGSMFQVSNQTTLGEAEEDIIKRLTRIVAEVAEHEKNGRLRLMQQRKTRVSDYVGRAYGILSNARLLSSRETLDLLSSLRLGLDLGMVANVTASDMYELILLTQPAHMQRMMGRQLNPEERDETRARIVADKLKGISVQI
jgi:protein arginine kinase